MADKSNAIMWIIGICIYYVGIIALLGFASGVDEDIQLSDGGFLTIDQLRLQGGSCGFPVSTPLITENPFYTCGNTLAYDNTTCTSINGCYWEESGILELLVPDFWGGFVQTSFCKGNVNATYYNDFTELNDRRYCEASRFDDSQSLCTTMGCTWTDYSEMSNEELNDYVKTSPRKFLNSISFLSGFRADFGFDGFGYAFISFLLFYIPLILLIGAIYMLVPFI